MNVEMGDVGIAACGLPAASAMMPFPLESVPQSRSSNDCLHSLLPNAPRISCGDC